MGLDGCSGIVNGSDDLFIVWFFGWVCSMDVDCCLAAFFVAAVHDMAMEKQVCGWSLSAIFVYILQQGAKVVGIIPIWIYWISSKHEKMKKTYFCWDLRGRRGERVRDTLQWNFVLVKQFFIDTSFFNFRINTGVAIPKIEFKKDNFYRGIKLIYWRFIWKIGWIYMFVIGGSDDMQRLQRHAVDMWLSKKCTNIVGHQILSHGFYDILPSRGHV